jgi:hypothetical protein
MGGSWRKEQLSAEEGRGRMVAHLRFATALIALLGSACTHVAAYERGRLAHPMMTADDLDGPAAAHVMAVHEGATGGGSLSQSGCGCN